MSCHLVYIWSILPGNSFSDADRCLCAGYDNGDLKVGACRDSLLIGGHKQSARMNEVVDHHIHPINSPTAVRPAGGGGAVGGQRGERRHGARVRPAGGFAARFAASCWWRLGRGHCLWDNGDNDNEKLTRLFSCLSAQDIEMNKLVVTTLEAHFRVYDMRCVVLAS